jgi:cytochrome c5
MSEQKGESATSPAMILAAVVGVFAVPVLAIVMIVQLVLSMQAGHVDKNDPRMSEAAVKERIKPYGEVKAIDPSAPRVEKTGEAVYTEVCASCHGTGALNAPKLGDKGDWGKRNAQGFDTLVKNATNGIRAMPARGGNPELSDIEMSRVVAYMANAGGASFKPKEPAPAK